MSQVTFNLAGGSGTVMDASLGAINVETDPFVAVNDILILIVHTANQSVTTPSGWNTTSTNVAGSTVTLTAGAVGTAASAGSIGLYIFWKRAAAGDIVNGIVSVDVADSGNHQFCQILNFKNCSTTGGPIDAYAVSNVTTASTTYVCPDVTTLSPDNLVVFIMANAVDSNTNASPTTVTNSNLSSITNRANNNANTGTGGGFSVVTGVETLRNFAIGTSSGTGTSSVQCNATLVLRPERSRSSAVS